MFEILENLPYFIFSLSKDNCLFKLERVNVFLAYDLNFSSSGFF